MWWSTFTASGRSCYFSLKGFWANETTIWVQHEVKLFRDWGRRSTMRTIFINAFHSIFLFLQQLRKNSLDNTSFPWSLSFVHKRKPDWDGGGRRENTIFHSPGMCRRQCVCCGSWRDLYWWRKLSKSSRRQLRGSCNELNQSGKFVLSKTSHYRPKPIQSLRRNVKLALFMKVVSALQNTNYSGQ